jgi:hypothetical protein
MASNTIADDAAVRRLKAEIAKDKARLAEQLAKVGLDDDAGVPEAPGATTGRLSRVFGLMNA